MEPLEKLASVLARLPGVGKRSAARMAARIARDRNRLLPAMAAALADVREHVTVCSRCGSLTAPDEEPCRLCVSDARDARYLCVVEDPDDIITIERSGGYHGRYHALMGKISPMTGTGPADLRLKELIARISTERYEEVILALNTDVESDATARFISDMLRERGVAVSRLAFGLPVGSGIAYSDAVTLSRAFEGRRAL